jgi:hypothetical protein
MSWDEPLPLDYTGEESEEEAVKSDDVEDNIAPILEFLTVWAPQGNWAEENLYAFAYVSPPSTVANPTPII